MSNAVFNCYCVLNWQAINMSLCLQSIVDEIVRVKNGRPVKKVANLKLLF